MVVGDGIERLNVGSVQENRECGGTAPSRGEVVLGCLGLALALGLVLWGRGWRELTAPGTDPEWSTGLARQRTEGGGGPLK